MPMITRMRLALPGQALLVTQDDNTTLTSYESFKTSLDLTSIYNKKLILYKKIEGIPFKSWFNYWPALNL